MNQYHTLRRTLGVNQQQFWSAVGVTQSGGSRYESSRTIPKPTAELVRLRHELGIDTSLIDEGKAKVIRALLSGELDANNLAQTAETAHRLMQSAGQLSSVAADLSHKIAGV